MKNRRHTFVVLLLLTVALTLVILWRIGLIGIWSDGMARIADNTKDFSDHNGYAIQGEYAIAIKNRRPRSRGMSLQTRAG
ncbi:hypothetical protein [Cohnella hongkongensis]|uniref:Uncharacterized protein n=1 Tax=Cohnella hongkongensis TaxID=178337 RepID=A0ABV9FIT5_9BACL